MALLGAGACRSSPDSSPAAADKPLAATLQGVTVRFDYAGADNLLLAFDRPVLSPAEAQRLLEGRGVAAMVDNTAKYVPGLTRVRLSRDAVTFSKTHKPVGDEYFGPDQFTGSGPRCAPC
ncbi:MAG: hypothetical protein WKG07_30700 [Hymenobacter sp.]